MDYALEISNISKSFKNIKAVNNIYLTIKSGEMVGLIGPSGSGKSTLLRLISGLMPSDSDRSFIKVFDKVVINNGSVSNEIRKIRNSIGFIFQKFNLVERLDLFTNVLTGNLGKMPPLRSWTGFFTSEEKIRAVEALKRVNMLPWAFQKARTLSGGQQQRAAIARTIVQKSKIILADEPIASLDPASSRSVMQLLKEINVSDNVTVIVTLHQVDYALKYCNRIVALKDGEIIFDGGPNEITDELLHKIYGAKFEETGIEFESSDEKKVDISKNKDDLENFAEIKSQM